MKNIVFINAVKRYELYNFKAAAEQYNSRSSLKTRKLGQLAMSFLKLSVIASSLGLGCLLLMAQPASAQTPTVHKLGVLTSSDSQLGDGSYFDSYEIAGSEGQRVTISLDSSDFNAFLGLADSEGNLVASNDDATDSNQNAFLSLTLPKDDVYTVFATSRNPQVSGDYRMVLRNFSPPRRSAVASSSGSSELRPVINPFSALLLLGLGFAMFGGGGDSSAGNTAYPDPAFRNTSQPHRPAQPSAPRAPAIDPFFDGPM